MAIALVRLGRHSRRCGHHLGHSCKCEGHNKAGFCSMRVPTYGQC